MRVRGTLQHVVDAFDIADRQRFAPRFRAVAASESRSKYDLRSLDCATLLQIWRQRRLNGSSQETERFHASDIIDVACRRGSGLPRKTMVKAAIGLLVRPLIWRLRLNGQARLVLLHLIMLSFATQAVKPVVKVSFCLPVVRDRYCI